MDHKSSAPTSSWLPPAGTRERTVTLKKLKRNLESRGLTTHEVYTALLQLITSPRVLVERWRAHGVSNEKSDTTTIESEILLPAKNIERDEVRVDDTTEANNTEILDVKNEDIVSCPPKAKTPELMDERVGGVSRSFVKIPRKVISFNRHAYEAQCVNVNHKKQKISTEISPADSSVSDDGNSTFYPAVANLNKKEDAPISKKPKIVEDVTCLEGTLLGKRLLLDPSRVAINETVQPKNDVGCGIREENNKNVITPEVPIRRKRPARKIYCCRKKSRIRRTFRQLFGNISTSSELDEEDDIVERFLSISRRKKSRNSSDSGVGLVEINSENTYICPSDSEQQTSSEASTRSSSEELVIDHVKEETDEPEIPLRSMPLLDSLPSASNSIGEILADNLPDSSTSASEDSPAQADSSSADGSNAKKTFTILVSPVDVNSSDAFSPLTLEIDIPCENPTLVPTSTTQHFSQVLTIPKIEANENTGEKEYSPKYVDISDEEEREVVPPSLQHSKNEAMVVDNLASELPSEEPGRGTATVAQDLARQGTEEISLCKDFENVTPIPEPEAASSNQEIPKNSTERPAAETDQRDRTNELMAQPASSSSPSMPRIRVLLPSELGSRWCPTPLNIPPSSQNILNVPSANLSWSAPPVLQNYQPQGNGMPNFQAYQDNVMPNNQPYQGNAGIPNVQLYQGNGIANVQLYQGNGISNVQPDQTFQNSGCTVSSNNAKNTSGMYRTNYGRAYSQQRYAVQNPSPPAPDPQTQSTVWKKMGTIFRLFSSLDTCIRQNETTSNPKIAMDLHNRFKAEKNLLEFELHHLGTLLGIPEQQILKERLIKIYEETYQGSPKVSRQQILTVLHTASLRDALPPMPTPVNFQLPMYRNQFASPLRPPPPPYSPCSGACCLPRNNNLNSIPQYVSSRPFLPANPDQRTFSGTTLSPSPNFPLTQAQLDTLRCQIIIYNQLIAQKPKNPRRSKKSPTKKTQRTPKASKSVQRVAPIPTLVDPVSPISPAAQNIPSPIPTPPCQELENISRLANQMNEPQSSENVGAGGRRLSLESVLEFLKAMSQTVTDNGEPDNNNNSNNNNNEQQITKTTSPTCSPTLEKRIISETTHPVQEQTTYPVEGGATSSLEEIARCTVQQEETTCPVDEATTLPVEEETRCRVGEETTCPVEEETTCRDQEETTCSVEEETSRHVEEETIRRVEKETTCPVQEETTCRVGEETTCYVEEETTCYVKEETKCLVDDGTTCLVEEVKFSIGEATTSLVDEETNNPFKEEMPHSNNTEKNDDVRTCSNYEIIDVPDDCENVEEEITTDSKVSVIVLNDSTNENTAIPNNEDTEINFNILEVKSITKDIFDNLGMSQEESSPQTYPEATTDDIENLEDSTSNSELRNCLRCGEPSSVVCEQCYEAFYCSSECHETDWTEHHYLTCKPVPAEALALFEMNWNSQINLHSLDKLSTK